MIPSKLGLDVYYVKPLTTRATLGELRAAKIVKINDDETCNLCVFKEHVREGSPQDSESATYFLYSIRYCSEGSPDTWHLTENVV